MRKKLTSITVAIKPAQVLLLIVCLVAFLAAGFLGIGPSAKAQDQTSDVSFNNPEDAITFYMQAIAQGDAAQIIQACAVNEMGENFRFDLFVNRLRALTFQAPAPSDYPFYAEINKAQFSWQILFQARNLAYGLLTTQEDLLKGRAIYNIEPEGTTQFMNEVDPAKLAQLQVMQIGVPSPELASTERNLENWNRIAQFYGADEYTERVALLLFEGDFYIVGFSLLRYGDNWKISFANSALGGTVASGVPEVITEGEFQELIGGS